MWGAACWAVLAVAGVASAGTLEDVKTNGILKCGVTTGNAGFSAPDEKGEWEGFDVDLCRAVAAAVLGDPTKVQFTPLSAKDRFPALQSGEIDILSRQTTWVLSREASLGFLFGAVTYYDGQGFLINSKKMPDVTSALGLSGATICLLAGTTTELNLADYFKANNLEYSPLVFEKIEEAKSAYDSGRCDVYSDDQSNLYSARLSLSAPAEHAVLPEIISKEPLGPVVRQGDDRWFNIVKWTHFAMVQAEEFGITQANVDEMKTSPNPEVKRLLGMEADAKLGTDLGLTEDWVVRIVKAVGNYGEVFDRNIGSGSPLKIARGLNGLWTDHGLQYAMPVR
ncbi:amino acid ABC transporter substrate-binding protein [Shinella sp. YE25]|uniref:amino acid ABC transporter substrate-binding protein n=1 Tax=Shinella sp. TaxID=1870904 RepID=UPI00234E60EF|nr:MULTISPECIES: amino acid ABC transporter substrate-binding protein [unclassified Shinella]MCW5709280.1 amino acid ABC transporter substrate-binding protein [Shinella sp.]MDC7258866.1 amino acid ABC transporter substrate-binding protein [Shinella sp. YE25]